MASKRTIKRDFWQRHIESWQASSLTQKQYCQRENIGFSSFTSWRSKLSKISGKKERRPSVSFLPAAIKERQSTLTRTATEMILVLPNQSRLVLPSHLPINDLATLVKALGGLS